MRSFKRWALGLCLIGAAAPASGATLPFTATLTIALGDLPPINMTASGTAFSAGAGGSFTLPSGLFATSVYIPPTSITAITIHHVTVQLLGNGPGSFNPSFAPPLGNPSRVALLGNNLVFPPSPPGTGVGGGMPLLGSAFVNIFGLFTMTLPFSVGAGTSTQMATQGGIVITVVQTFWSTGFGLGLPANTPYDFFLLTGSDSRTPGGAGPVTLVTPVVAVTNAGRNFGIGATLTVNFIPEPGTALALAAGVVGLGVAGRRRQRAS